VPDRARSGRTPSTEAVLPMCTFKLPPVINGPTPRAGTVAFQYALSASTLCKAGKIAFVSL
jgi:hypothetical protein